MSDEAEEYFVLREAKCNEVEEAFFKHRPQLDNELARRIFRAAFERGWDRRAHSGSEKQ